MFDVVVVGGAGVDYLVRGPELPNPARTMMGDRFIRSPGGKGLNQAVAAARLGARTALVCRVGRDPDGDDISGCLGEEDVHGAVERDPACATSITLIQVDARGRKQSAAVAGANAFATLDESALSLVRAARVLLLQLEIPIATSLGAAEEARRAGALIVFDAAPAAPVGDELLRLADIVTVNASEAEALTCVHVDDRASARRAARKLRDRGAAAVAIGATGGRLVQAGALDEWLPDIDVEVVDTTGAGDACAAAIAVALADGRTRHDACVFGHAAAALATTVLGALPSLPRRDQVESILQAARR